MRPPGADRRIMGGPIAHPSAMEPSSLNPNGAKPNFARARGVRADAPNSDAPAPPPDPQARPAQDDPEALSPLQLHSAAPTRIREVRAAAHAARPLLASLELQLVRVSLGSGARPRLQWMLERRDGTLSIDDCVAASRALSPLLDAEDPIQGPYVLEVSSPGEDRPLTRPKDFIACKGRTVSARFRVKTPGAAAPRTSKLRAQLEEFDPAQKRIRLAPLAASDDAAETRPRTEIALEDLLELRLAPEHPGPQPKKKQGKRPKARAKAKAKPRKNHGARAARARPAHPKTRKGKHGEPIA